MKSYTQSDLYAAEEACRMAHRRLGMKKDSNRAITADYQLAEQAATRLDKIRESLTE